VLLDTRLVAAGPAREVLTDANLERTYRSHLSILGARPE
jgi:hypothetical protein